MTPAKCLTVFIVVGVLIVMLIMYRKKTNQILLSVALAISLLGGLRLFQIRDSDETVQTAVFIMGAMALVWVFSWLSNRAAVRRGRSASGGGSGRQLPRKP